MANVRTIKYLAILSSVIILIIPLVFSQTHLGVRYWPASLPCWIRFCLTFATTPSMPHFSHNCCSGSTYTYWRPLLVRSFENFTTPSILENIVWSFPMPTEMKQLKWPQRNRSVVEDKTGVRKSAKQAIRFLTIYTSMKFFPALTNNDWSCFAWLISKNFNS